MYNTTYSETNKGINKLFLLLVLGTCISLTVCFTLQTLGDYNFFNQWVLTLCYLICLVLFTNNKRYLYNYSLCIINILLFIRYSILPLSFYITTNGVLRYSYEFLNKSLLLMIYEMIAVFIAIQFFSAKFFKDDLVNTGNIINENKKMQIGTLIIIILFIVVLFLYPQYIKQLFNFRFTTMEEVVVDSSVDGFYRIVYRTGLITIGCTLLTEIYKRYRDKNMFFISLIIAIYFIWVASQGSSGNISRTAFLSNGIAFFFIITQLYPKKKKLILILSLIAMFLLIIIGTMVRFSYGNELNFQSISNTIREIFNYDILDLYFGGVEGVNVALKTSSIFSRSITFNTLVNDMVSQIPFVGTRIGINFQNITPVYFNYVYFGYFGNVTKICPFIGQGYIFFGSILSPIFSILCIYFSFYFNKRLKYARDLISVYTFALCIYSFSTFVMYNFNILSIFLWNRLFPFLLIIIFNNLFIKKRGLEIVNV